MAQYAIWQQNEEFSARKDRGIIEALFTEGVLDPGGAELAVSERSLGANMSVDVAPGRAVVDGDEQADQRAYLAVNEDDLNLAVTAADATNTRYDRVVVRVRDSAVSGVVDGPVVEVIAGTAGSGDPPAEPDSAVTLATVEVGAGVSSITDADITDQRLPSTPQSFSFEVTADILAEDAFLRARTTMARSDKDADDIFRTVSTSRSDGTLLRESVLGPVGEGPEYPERTVTFYESDGTTVRDTIVYDLTYDVDGDVVDETEQV